MSADLLISIVTPAFNATAFYDAWLGSIQSQCYSNVEVVLVDDGSTDDLPARAKKAPPFLRYIRQDNGGPAAARNAGIRASKGDLIAFLDMDDLWARGHLCRMVTALRDQPNFQIAQGLIRNFLYDEGRPLYCSRPYRFINLGSAIFRRQVFETCGLFDEDMQFAEDFDFVIRCWEQGMRKRDIEELSLLYHRHANNMTSGKSLIEMGGVAIYKRHLDRLRAGSIRVISRDSVEVRYADYVGRSVWPFDEGLREPI